MSELATDPGERDGRPRHSKKQAADSLGDLLPDITRDEHGSAWGEEDASSRDADLLRDVPPHHG